MELTDSNLRVRQEDENFKTTNSIVEKLYNKKKKMFKKKFIQNEQEKFTLFCQTAKPPIRTC